ncbi:NB-ARC domain-containing protein [Aerosakkonema funiforme]|uniref:NB-ARC domain-containing protein n=1 Tax=Aerosakkonema funiforme TaxID=1246630 RepID=UPI0035B8BD2C
MDVEKAIEIINAALQEKPLNKFEKMVLRQCWEGRSYEEIATSSGYNVGHVKNIGCQLWKKLSLALGERVTKTNFRNVLKRYSYFQTTLSQLPERQKENAVCLYFTNGYPQQYWQEPIDVSYFYGRTAELATVKTWIVQDRCRMVALLGMAGIGKTAFAVKLAQQLRDEFDYIIWRSLSHAPDLADELAAMIGFFSNHQESVLPNDLDSRILQLIDYLYRYRCLVILDKVESLFATGELVGKYRQGYEEYGKLFKKFGQSLSNSCLLLTSREKPREIALFEGEKLPIRSLQIKGLSRAEIPKIFKLKDSFSASEWEWETIGEYYGGNPLLLKIVATKIQDLFNGDVSHFLFLQQHCNLIFDNINEFLEEQFNRCSDLEKEIMYWLAINREPMSMVELQSDILSLESKQKLPDSLISLESRSLIENYSATYTPMSEFKDYVNNRLIILISQEITFNKKNLLHRLCLWKSPTGEDLLSEEINFILKPIVEKLRQHYEGQANLEKKLNEILLEMRSQLSKLQGYAEINMITLQKVAAIAPKNSGEKPQELADERR